MLSLEAKPKVYEVPDGAIYIGNSLEVLRTLPAASVQCLVTSSPYYLLRSYEAPSCVFPKPGSEGCDHEWEPYVRPWNNRRAAAMLAHGEDHMGSSVTDVPRSVESWYCRKCRSWKGHLGLEPSLGEFIEHLVLIFAEAKRVLRPDGLAFFNIGDSYNNSGKGPGGSVKQLSNVAAGDIRLGATREAGVRDKSLLLVPERLAIALSDAGWIVRSRIAWCLGHSVRVYAKTQKGEMPMTVGEMVRLRPETVQLWSGDKWVQVRAMHQNDSDEGLELQFRNGQRIPCTPEHLWPTERGKVEARDLRVGDRLKGVRLPQPAEPESPVGIPERFGYVVGVYLAEGNEVSGGVRFSLHSDEWQITDHIREFAEFYGSSCTCHDHEQSRTVNVMGGAAAAVLRAYVTGGTAKHKHLTTPAWQRSNLFLAGVMEGYLDGDGYFEAATNRWRLGFTRNDAWADDLRTLSARLGHSLRLHRHWHQSQTGKFYGWRGDLRLDPKARKSCDWEIVGIAGAKGEVFYDIAIDEPHVFTLACGLLTHNCKLAGMPESMDDRPSSAWEHIWMCSQAEDYFFDAFAVKEAATETDLRGPALYAVTPNGGTNSGLARREPTATRNIRNYWVLPPAPDDCTACEGCGSFYDGPSLAHIKKRIVDGKVVRTCPVCGRTDAWISHYACVDAETECLTAHGWKTHDQLQPGELVAGFDPATRLLSWQQLAAVNRYEVADVPMIRAKTGCLDMLLTPNHRVLIKRRLRLGTSRFEVVEASSLKAQHAIPTSAEWEAGGVRLSPEWAELVGWYIAEGHELKNSLSVEIYQSLSANPEAVDRIRSLLQSAEADFSEVTTSRMWRGRPTEQTIFKVRGFVAASLRAAAPDKHLPEDCLLWDNEAVDGLLTGLIGGDGHTRADDGRLSFTQKSPEVANLVHALAVRAGYSATLRPADGNKLFRLYLTQHRHRTIRTTKGESGLWQEARYSGTVWCPTTPSGTWVARRQGVVFITGNSFPIEVPRRIIKMATSERGACPTCGKPWERVLAKYRDAQGSQEARQRVQQRIQATGGVISGGTENSTLAGRREDIHLGWAPGCKCYGLPPRPPAPKAKSGPEFEEWVTAARLWCSTYQDLPAVPCRVLDPFVGSGTTLLAARELGRVGTGIDISDRYIQMIALRKLERKQPTLGLV